MALHYDHGKWQNNRATFLKVGLCMSILSCIIVFQIEVKSNPVVYYDTQEVPELATIEIPRTDNRKKKIPPPPPPKPKSQVIEIEPVDDLPKEETEVDDQPVEKTESTELTNLVPEPEPVDTPAPIVEPAEDQVVDETVYNFVDRMPCYAECYDLEDFAQRKSCTDKRLLEQIYETLKYPSFARNNGIEGNVIISFTISKKGQIKDLEILRDIGGGCGEAVLKSVSMLDEMLPGKHRGVPVNVSYKMPVKFVLNK